MNIWCVIGSNWLIVVLFTGCLGEIYLIIVYWELYVLVIDYSTIGNQLDNSQLHDPWTWRTCICMAEGWLQWLWSDMSRYWKLLSSSLNMRICVAEIGLPGPYQEHLDIVFVDRFPCLSTCCTGINRPMSESIGYI